MQRDVVRPRAPDALDLLLECQQVIHERLVERGAEDVLRRDLLPAALARLVVRDLQLWFTQIRALARENIQGDRAPRELSLAVTFVKCWLPRLSTFPTTKWGSSHPTLISLLSTYYNFGHVNK